MLVNMNVVSPECCYLVTVSVVVAETVISNVNCF